MEPLSAEDLRNRFDAVAGGTVGVEEEVMVLDARSLELAPRAPELLARLDGDPRFKLELPAAQLELALGPFGSAQEAAAALLEARRAAAAAGGDDLCLGAAGVHPFSAGLGALNSGERYEHTAREYGPLARRQLVCALQVHVAVGGAERTLAVYNALRSHLPLLAALAANAPFYEGRDSGLQSVRPKLSELLPRQGVPPVIESWEEHAEALAWGRRAGAFGQPGTWWWELRPHPGHGTLELRVPDAQSSVSDAGAVIAVAHALCLWLAARYDAGERLAVFPRWRIEENRWSACRYGVDGTMGDLASGQPAPTRTRLNELLDAIAATAQAHGGGAGLAVARRLIDRGGGASELRRAADAATGEPGVRAATRWLVDRFLATADG